MYFSFVIIQLLIQFSIITNYNYKKTIQRSSEKFIFKSYAATSKFEFAVVQLKGASTHFLFVYSNNEAAEPIKSIEVEEGLSSFISLTEVESSIYSFIGFKNDTFILQTNSWDLYKLQIKKNYRLERIITRIIPSQKHLVYGLTHTDIINIASYNTDKVELVSTDKSTQLNAYIIAMDFYENENTFLFALITQAKNSNQNNELKTATNLDDIKAQNFQNFLIDSIFEPYLHTDMFLSRDSNLIYVITYIGEYVKLMVLEKEKENDSDSVKVMHYSYEILGFDINKVVAFDSFNFVNEGKMLMFQYEEKKNIIGLYDINSKLVISSNEMDAEYISVYEDEDTFKVYIIDSENKVYLIDNFIANGGVKKCSSQEDFIIISSEENACGKCQNKILESKYCVDTCPQKAEGNSCKLCPGYQAYDSRNQECIECSGINGYGEDHQGNCINCRSINKISFDNKCINLCIRKETDKNNYQCKVCDKGPFYNKICYYNCPDGTIKSIDKNICEHCKDNIGLKYLNEDGKACTDQCSIGYEEENNKCQSCEKTEDGKCVKKCSRGSIVDKGKCVKCKDSNEKYEGEKCVPNCSTGKISDADNVCGTCRELYPEYQDFYYQGKCRSSCPFGTVQDTNFVCSSCKEIDPNKPFYFDGACEAQCPEYYVPDETNICQKCSENEFYMKEEKKCSESCGEECHQYSNGDEKVCVCCKDDRPFYYKQECVESCESGSYYDSKNTCIKCLDNGEYFIDKGSNSKNTCRDHCEYGEVEDAVNKVCRSCKDNEEYFYNIQGVQKCVKTCDYCKDEENKLCSLCKCQDVDKEKSQFIEEGECVKQCKRGSIVNEINECKHCQRDFGKFYDEENNECVSSCPKGFTHDDDFVCTFCEDIIYKNLCVKICPFFYSKEDKTCVDCKSGYYYHIDKNVCLEQCYEDDVADEGSLICVSKKDKCVSDCFGHGVCDGDVCKCDSGFSGDNCQVVSTSSEVEIKSKQSSIIIGSDNEFYFLKGKIQNITEIVWSASFYTETNRKKFVNGFHEETFKISSGAFEDGLQKISIIIKDESNKEYTGEFKFYAKSFVARDIFEGKIEYLRKDKVQEAIAMDTIVYLSVALKDKKSSSQRLLSTEIEKYKFQFFYQCPSTLAKVPLNSMPTSSTIYSHYLPYTKKVYVKIFDSYSQYDFLEIDANVIIDKKTMPASVGEALTKKPSKKDNQLELNNYLNTGGTFGKDDISSINELLKDLFSMSIKDEDKYSDVSGVMNTVQLVIKATDNSITNTVLNEYSKLMQEFSEEIFTTSIKREDTESVYETVDNILNLYAEKGKIKNFISNDFEASKNIKGSLKSLNSYISLGIAQGENVMVNGTNFNVHLVRPGRSQKFISLSSEEEKQTKTIDNFLSEESDKETCDVNSRFCITSDEYSNTDEYVSFIESTTSLKDLSFNILEINNTNFYNDTTTTSNSIITTLFNTQTNITTDIDIKYSFEFTYDNETTKEMLYNTSCYSVSSSNKVTTQCSTYFNYEERKIVCICQGVGEFVAFANKTITRYSKDTQYKKLAKYFFNPLSMAIIATTFVLITCFSVVLLLIDFCDDQKTLQLLETNDHKIFFDNFLDMRGMAKKNLFFFTWYVTCYKYTFLSMFNLYGYNQPRFIRYAMEIMTLIISLIFSILPYYTKEFDYQKEVIDKRDVKTKDWDINDLPAEIIDLLISLGYSLCATIITLIIVELFSLMIGFDKIVIQVWEKRYRDIQEYVKHYIVFSDSSKKAFNNPKLLQRLKALAVFESRYLKLCEIREERIQKDLQFFLNGGKKKKETHKHTYYIERCSNFSLNVPKNEDDDISEELITLANENEGTPSSPTLRSSRKLSSCILTVSEIAERLKVLKIYRTNTLSILNETPNYALKNFKNSELRSIILTTISTILIMMLFFGMFFLIAFLLEDIYSRYGYYIVKVWLFPSLLQLIFVRLLTTYAINFAFLFIYSRWGKIDNKIMNLYDNYIISDDLKYMYDLQKVLNEHEESLTKLQEKWVVDM